MVSILVTSKHRPTTLCLVRHGESTWNAEKRIQGQSDPPLSELGQQQAQLVAERLASETWDVLYASDLRRAFQTAIQVSHRVQLPIFVDEGFRERGQGKREGLLGEEAKKMYPDIHAPEVGRETDEALQQRAVATYEKIRDRHLGQRIIVVAHGALMRSFLQHAIDVEETLRIANTSCTLIHWDGQRWYSEYVGDAEHLTHLK